MYGVPEDLNLGFLHNSELVQVCLGIHQVQFHFHPTGKLCVEGEWELLAADNSAVDRHLSVPRKQPFELHRLLGQRVIGSQISAPNWFALRFEGGEVLRIFDSSQHHESFSIEPGPVVV